MADDRPYHHGDLRATLLRAAVEVIAESGAAALSMREVTRRAGVSHAAATYHFGDKRGLLTAIAVDGYRALHAELAAAERERRSFLEVGVAYVRFALSHPAYFDVMFQPHLHEVADVELREAKRSTAAVLYGIDDGAPTNVAAGVAAWSLVHGLATLWANGNLPAQLGEDPEAVTRAVAAHLRVPRASTRT
jgi:AcrR family transcriptional regulator